MTKASGPITGTMKHIWQDDDNLRNVAFDLDYEIEPWEPICPSRLTPPTGGGVEIVDIRCTAFFLYDTGEGGNTATPGDWWLALYANAELHRLSTDTAAYLIDAFRASRDFTNLEDACREHAESEV